MAAVGRVPGARRVARAGPSVQTHTAVRPRGPRARLSVGGVLCPPPPQLELMEPSTGSHCAELGQWPRHRGKARDVPRRPRPRHHHVLLDHAVSCQMSLPFSRRDTRGLLPGCPGLTSIRHVHRALVQEPSARSTFTVFLGLFPKGHVTNSRHATAPTPSNGPSSPIKGLQSCDRGLHDKPRQKWLPGPEKAWEALASVSSLSSGTSQ